MKHVYKQGGAWNKNGIEYTIECVNDSDLDSYLDNGWSLSLEDALAIESTAEVVSESGSDYEAELREKIKALGGKAGGRSSIETLEKQLAELEKVGE